MKDFKFKEGDVVKVREGSTDYRIKGKFGIYIVKEQIDRGSHWYQYMIENINDEDDWEQANEEDIELVS